MNCGKPIGGDALAAPDPVVIVEVLSPSRQPVDTEAKLAGHLSLPSVRHCLVVHADRRALVNHQRAKDGTIRTRLMAEGTTTLDSRGIRIAMEKFSAP